MTYSLVGVDVGGTFTDGVYASSKEVRRAKVPSRPDDPTAALLEVLEALGVPIDQPQWIVHGSTIVTNLLIEGKGCEVGLITTKGFRDVIEVRRSYREKLYDLKWRQSTPIIPRHLRMEVHERTASDGRVLIAPNREEVVWAAQQLADRGAEAIVVAFMNSHVNPQTELTVANWLSKFDIPLSVSSIVDGQIREYERFCTTAINASAMPATADYISDLQSRVRDDLLLMHSAGGSLPANEFVGYPAKLVMSGPAGGVVASLSLIERMNVEDAITMDMGGTSTDVAVIVGGKVPLAEEYAIAWDVPLRSDGMDVKSVGAGGGSIAWIDPGGALRVGPTSAGSEPGPACYQRGGTDPTVTDANLVLGLLDPARRLGGDMRLDTERAVGALSNIAGDYGVDVLEVASAIHRIVNANMAQLIRELTVNRGRDPHGFMLLAFGGAAGQHAYDVAAQVGCRGVIFPTGGSMFSAEGLICAAPKATEVKALIATLETLQNSDLRRVLEELGGKAKDRLSRVGLSTERVAFSAKMRYAGQTHSIQVEVEESWSVALLNEAFESRHEEMYGTRLGDPVEVVSLHATAMGVDLGAQALLSVGTKGTTTAEPVSSARRYVALFDQVCDVYDTANIDLHMRLSGPLVIETDGTTVVVPEGATVYKDSSGSLVMTLEGSLSS